MKARLHVGRLIHANPGLECDILTTAALAQWRHSLKAQSSAPTLSKQLQDRAETIQTGTVRRISDWRRKCGEFWKAGSKLTSSPKYPPVAWAALPRCEELLKLRQKAFLLPLEMVLTLNYEAARPRGNKARL